MKKSIHPQYNNIKIKCACGAVYDVGSTSEDINTEICSQCHPFFTGKQKLVDTAGRVDKYEARKAKIQELASTVKYTSKKAKKAKLKEKRAKKNEE